MKNYTLIIVLLLFTATASRAQSVVSTISINEKVKVEKPKVKVEKPKVKKDWWANPLKKGYRGFVEAGASIEILHETGGFNLFTTHGYQFNRRFYLGAGIGVEGISHYEMVMSVPIFADFRAYFTGTKVKPFCDVQVGYKIGCNMAPEDCTHSYGENVKYDGVHAALGIGIEYKWLSVKLAYDIGYYIYNYDDISELDNDFANIIRIGLGVNF